MGTRGRGDWRRRPWVWLVFGGLLCLVGTAMALTAPSLWAERAAYQRAEPVLTTATVERTRVDRFRSDDYLVWLRLPGQPRPVVAGLPVPDDVFPALTPGREVTVRVWEGEVTWLDVPGVASAETEDSPAVASLEQPVAGGTLAAGGGFGVWYGLALRHGRPDVRRRGPRAAAGRALLGAAAGTGAGMFLVTSFDVYAAWAYALTTGAVALVVWGLLRHRSG